MDIQVQLGTSQSTLAGPSSTVLPPSPTSNSGGTSSASSASNTTSGVATIVAASASRSRRGTSCGRCASRKKRCDPSDIEGQPCASCLAAKTECVYIGAIPKRKRDASDVGEPNRRSPSAAIESRAASVALPAPRPPVQLPSVSAPHPAPAPLPRPPIHHVLDDATRPDAARYTLSTVLESSAYGGPSSNPSGSTWAKLILSGIQSASPTGSQTLAPHSSSSSHAASPEAFHAPQLSDDVFDVMPQETAQMMLQHCYRHIQSRYPFIDWLKIDDFWNRRKDVVRDATLPGASAETRLAAFFVWMFCAVGARLATAKNPLPGLAEPELFFAKALPFLDATSTQQGAEGQLLGIQGLMLLVMYSFRSAEAPSVNFLVGVIMRQCTTLGLHRESRGAATQGLSLYAKQMRRRVLWSVFVLDRQACVATSTPPQIALHDIDTLLPLNIDCLESEPSPDADLSGTTSMTSAIHLIKMKQIEARIQMAMYRVDEAPSETACDALLAKLDEWEKDIPDIAGDPERFLAVPSGSRDWFLMRLCEARLYLLRPLALCENPNRKSLRILVQTAAEACMIHKRLHQAPTSVMSFESLRSIFLSGLTLLHAVKLSPHSLSPLVLQRAIRACSNTIFGYAQRFEAAHTFHDLFEELADTVSAHIESSRDLAWASTAESEAGTPQVAGPHAVAPLEAPAAGFEDTFQDDYNALMISLGLPGSEMLNDPMAAGGVGVGYDMLWTGMVDNGW